MAHTNQYFPATKCIIFTLAIISAKIGLNSAAGTCPGFPGYCSESFPGQSCVVVCSRGRPNVPLCQSDGTWTDIPRCIEHDPGVQEQIPGLCPGIPGYCSASFIGHRCNFKCPVGPDIDSSCTGDGTWTPYPTCAGDLRETQDGCDGCPGPNGGKRNRTAEAILGPNSIPDVPRTTGITRPPKKQQDFGRNVRPSFAGNIIVGELPGTEKPKSTKSFIPPQQPKSNFVPNLAAAGLRTTPRPSIAPTKPVQQFPKLTAFQQQQAAAAARRQQQQPARQQPTRQQPMVQQQQPRLPAQKFGRPSTQQPPRQQFTGQQSFIQNQNAQTNTQLSGPRQSTLPNQPRRQGGFSSQQLDIIRNGFNRLNQNSFGLNKGQTSVNNISQSPNSRRPTQTQSNFQTVQQQQPRQPVQQQQTPRRPVVQQQPRQPVVQQQSPRQPTPVQRAPQPQATPRPAPTPARAPAPTPARAPAPAPAPAPTPAAPKPAGSTRTLSAFERAILKNAGVTKTPDTITKVERPKINEPRVVQFLAEEPLRNAGPPPVAGDQFFGPFEVFQPGQPGAGGPLPDLRAFPAIPESARNAPLPIGADPAGFGIFETVNLG